MDPELECFDAQSRKSEGFGELKEGFMVRCSLGMCRQSVISPLSWMPLNDSNRLLDPKHYLLPLLGSKFPLDVAVGVNGRVWINAKSPKHTIAIARCIEAADPDGGKLDEQGIKKFLNTLDI